MLSSTAAASRAFTDTFQDLHGLKQLPGVAVQRLMAEGYGFGAEGDWKTAALVRAMKVMAPGSPAGRPSWRTTRTTSESPAKCSGAHMLEVCPTIARDKPSLEDPSLIDRRKGGPGPAGVHRRQWSGGERVHH